MRVRRFNPNGTGDPIASALRLPAIDPEKALAANPPRAYPEGQTEAATPETGEDGGSDRKPPSPSTPAAVPGPNGLPPLARTPVVPAWLRDPRSTGGWALRYVAHVAGFQAVRFPAYVARATAYTPRGMARALTGLGHWALDAESGPLRAAAVDQKSTLEWIALDKARTAKVKVRGPGALVLVALAVAAVYAGLTSPGLVPALTALAVIAVAGWFGRPMDRPFIDSAVVTTPKARRLSADAISNAFIAAGLARLPDHVPTFWSRVARDGAGWGAVVDLPIGGGKTADDAIKARKKVAASLVVDEGRLFLSRSRGDGGSAGRVNFWLADSDPMAGPAPVSPLVKAAEVDLWSPVPFGVDERGRTVSINLLWTSFGFAGVPGSGKTASVRNLACAAGLDPFADLGVFDGKGEGGLSVDWDAVRELAEAYGAGDDDETARQLLAYAEKLVREMNRRSGAIASLPREQRRDGKLTRKLARSLSANMRLKVLIVDEAQDFIGDDVTSPYKDRLRAALTKLVKRGRFVGIIVVLATQKLDIKAIPSTIRDNLGSRFGLRVTTTVGNTMALGAGAAEQGFDATTLLPHHLGTGFLMGTAVPKDYASGGVLVRSNYIDLEAFERICERGRELRIAHGTLIGQAAGEAPDNSTVSLLDDIARAFRPGDVALWSEEIIERMAEANPGRYSFDPKSFGTTVKALSLDTVQITRSVNEKPVNRKGLTLEQVTEAFAQQVEARRAVESTEDDA